MTQPAQFAFDARSVFDEREIRKRDKRLPPSRGGMTTMSVQHFCDDLDRRKHADGRTYNEAQKIALVPN